MATAALSRSNGLDQPLSGTAGPPPDIYIESARYTLEVARTVGDLDAALRLRFEVFNQELGEGLRRSILTGRDQDDFDAQCHHLVVRRREDGEVVGTYRLQSAEMAARGAGFYSAGEFALEAAPPAVLADAIELGRACIAREHRNTRVLLLLWQGIARYAETSRKRYLFGCCSLTSQNPQDGIALARILEDRQVTHPTLSLQARRSHLCRVRNALAPQVAPAVPRLFEMYLSIGARVCSEPALDAEFRTIDFLVLFDLHDLDARARSRFFAPTLGAA